MSESFSALLDESLNSFTVSGTDLNDNAISEKIIGSTAGNTNSGLKIFEGFNIVYVENKGVSFGIFAEYIITFFLGVLSILISAYIVFLILKSKDSTERQSLALILGGALGNGFDRIIYGYVVDFIDIYYHDYHWPAFNFADTFITLGALVFVFSIILNKKN